jgi:predicted DNA-binding protein YlxM (UPF0122 family)
MFDLKDCAKTRPKQCVNQHLRLYGSEDYSQREISSILRVSRNTIRKCIERASRLEVPIPAPEAMSNEELAKRLFPAEDHTEHETQYQMPDFEFFAEEIKKPRVTKKTLWKEYVTSCTNSGLKT